MRISTTIAATCVAFIAACAVFVVSFGLAVPPIFAQDHPSAVKSVYSGEYVPLGFRTKLQLATAAALRPELYKRTELAYSYDPVAIKEYVTPEIIKAMTKGEVWLGVKSAERPLSVFLPTEEQQRTVDKIVTGKFAEEKFSAWLAKEHADALAKGENLVVVSTIDNLAGLKPESEYLSWDPKEAIGTAKATSSAVGVPETNVAPEAPGTQQ